MTLVEILTAMMVSVILLGTAFSTFWAATQAWEKAKRRSEMVRLLEGASQLVTRYLRTIEAPFLQGNSAFLAFNDGDETGDFDSILFLSSGNPRFPRQLELADLCEIEIYIDVGQSSEGTGTTTGEVSGEPAGEAATGATQAETERTVGGLWLRIDPTPDDDLLTGGYLLELGPQITSLDFRFFDGYEWLEEWYDDTQVPEAIEFSMTVSNPMGLENPMTSTRLVIIPAAKTINAGTLAGATESSAAAPSAGTPSTSTSGSPTGSAPTGSTGGQSSAPTR